MSLYRRRGPYLQGFAKGLGAGVLGCAVFTAWGTAVGLTQMVRGAMNHRESVAEAAAGKHWDEVERQWIEYLLPEAAAQIPVCRCFPFWWFWWFGGKEHLTTEKWGKEMTALNCLKVCISPFLLTHFDL